MRLDRVGVRADERGAAPARFEEVAGDVLGGSRVVGAGPVERGADDVVSSSGWPPATVWSTNNA